MGKKPLNVLKSGLRKLQGQIEERKQNLLVRLGRNERLEDISEAVHAKHKALKNLEINEGDDSDDDNLVIKKPNRREALAASLTLQQYISDIGDPFACELEAILASFGWQTRLRRLNPYGYPVVLLTTSS